MAACVEVAVIEDKERELCPDAGLGPDVRALALPDLFLLELHVEAYVPNYM